MQFQRWYWNTILYHLWNFSFYLQKDCLLSLWHRVNTCHWTPETTPSTTPFCICTGGSGNVQSPSPDPRIWVRRPWRAHSHSPHVWNRWAPRERNSWHAALEDGSLRGRHWDRQQTQVCNPAVTIVFMLHLPSRLKIFLLLEPEKDFIAFAYRLFTVLCLTSSIICRVTCLYRVTFFNKMCSFGLQTFYLLMFKWAYWAMHACWRRVQKCNSSAGILLGFNPASMTGCQIQAFLPELTDSDNFSSFSSAGKRPGRY